MRKTREIYIWYIKDNKRYHYVYKDVTGISTSKFLKGSFTIHLQRHIIGDALRHLKITKVVDNSALCNIFTTTSSIDRLYVKPEQIFKALRNERRKRILTIVAGCVSAVAFLSLAAYTYVTSI